MPFLGYFSCYREGGTKVRLSFTCRVEGQSRSKIGDLSVPPFNLSATREPSCVYGYADLVKTGR